MLCKRPFRVGVAEFGCGQCMPCRINRKRIWQLRLMLEATQHELSLFVTLTYNDEHLPVDKSVDVRAVQLFMKRLRKSIEPSKVRYYVVGEYGERRGRPHYHVCLFGDSSLRYERIVRAWSDERGVIGHVHVGVVSEHSAAYAANYVCKGMTRLGDDRLCGRRPEFCRMSLKPGIGAGAMVSVGEGVTTRAGARYVSIAGDVPNVLRVDGRKLPLGRYLQQRLRDECGYDKPAECFSYIVYLQELQSELREVSARVKRESVRVQHNYIAESRSRLSSQKRMSRETI